MRSVAMALLLGLGALLSACVPTSIIRNEIPPIPDYVQGLGLTGNATVLVLPVSLHHREGMFTNVFGNPGFSRRVHPPLFVEESELRELNTQLTRHFTEIYFLNLAPHWGLGILGASSNQTERHYEVVGELCVIWPNGQVLAVRGPSVSGWREEYRGVISDSWRKQMARAIATAKSLRTIPPLEACPYAEAMLYWTRGERESAVVFLNQITTTSP